MVIFLDSITRESIDPLKMILITIISTIILVFSLQEDAVVVGTFPNGEKSVFTNGMFRYAGAIAGLFSGLIYLFFMIKVYINSPQNLKRYATYNLIGAVIISLFPAMFVITGLSSLVPGTETLSFALGALISAFAFIREPKLAYVLPFKVLQLTIIDTSSGIGIFNYQWKSEIQIDSTLFSGMIQGISMMCKETVGQGNINEIHLDQAVLTLCRNDQYSLAFVLISTRNSNVLQESLNVFAAEFCTNYCKAFKTMCDVGQFNGASNLIIECFPMIPNTE